MPATYVPVSRDVPSSQRSGTITDIETGDEIDVTDVLGRPAQRIKIISSDETATIQLRLNNRTLMKPIIPGGIMTSNQTSTSAFYQVSKGTQHPLYTLTGSTQYYTEEGLAVSFIQVEDIDGVDSIDVYVW